MSLLHIPMPTLDGTRRQEHPLGDPIEYEQAAISNRQVRNWQRRKKSGGGARIDGQTRMQIVYNAIQANPGVSPKHLGRITDMDPSPVYVALKWLRNGGFIEMREWARHYVTGKAPPKDRRGEVGYLSLNRWRAKVAA